MMITTTDKYFTKNGIWFLLILISFIVSVLTPFSSDVLVSLGAAFQADYFGNFPKNVYLSWNLRGIGYKYFMYILIKCFGFINSYSHSIFPYLVRIVYYSFFIFISYLSIRELRPFFKEIGVDSKLVFLVFTLSILTTSQHLSLQAEEIAVFLTLVMTAFTFSKKKLLNYLSGFILLLLLSLKAVTIVFGGFPFLLTILFFSKYKEKAIRFIISNSVFLVLGVLFYIFVIPNEISDILMAAKFQDSSRFKATTPLLAGYYFFYAALYMPIIFMGLITAVLNLFSFYKNKQNLILLILFTIIPIFVVTLQHKWFSYHYSIFIPFSVISIFVFLYGRKKIKMNLKINSIIILYFAAYLLIQFLPYQIFPAKDKKFNFIYYTQEYYKKRQEVGEYLHNNYSSKKYSAVLYLTDGAVNYFYREKSYLRYFYPLPLQRAKDFPELKNETIYNETLKKVLNYNEDLIVLQSNWFLLEVYPELKEKIENNYKPDKKFVNNTNPNLTYEIYSKNLKK